MLRHATIIFLCCILAPYGNLYAQASKGKTKPIRYRAERLDNITVDGRIVQKFTGNVKFSRGDMNGSSDIAINYRDSRESELIGNVIIESPGRTLKADRVLYNSYTDEAFAFQNVVLVHENSTLYADTVHYFFESHQSDATGGATLIEPDRQLSADTIKYNDSLEEAHAFGGAFMTSLTERTTLTAGDVHYLSSLDSVWALRQPVLTRVDTAGGDTTFVSGKVISGNTALGIYFAKDSVTMKRGAIHAESGFLEYNTAADVITLDENPVVNHGDETLLGDRIMLLLEDRKITHIYVPQNARAHSTISVLERDYVFRDTTAADTTSDTARMEPILTLKRTEVTDRLSGKTIRMQLDDDELSSITVAGMAVSSYHAVEDSTLEGVNNVSGDTIIINFDDNELNQITVRGGARGKFIPHMYNPDIDTSIVYSSSIIHYDVPSRRSQLDYGAVVSYEELTLKADMIEVDWNRSILSAAGRWVQASDSVISAGGDTLEYTGAPVLQQRGSEPLYGTVMDYNMTTKRGKITEGITEFEDGLYRGKSIVRVDPKVFTVTDGFYTTCELDNPHFHFRSQKMKLIYNDKVIARPVRFYIMGIPTPLWLPYIIIPTKRGKHSGLIMPSYGNDTREGRYLRGGGFYWAGSDYHDATFRADFFDKSGFLFRLNTRYKLRYRLNGNFTGSMTRKSFSTYNKRKWDLKWTHNQTISPTLKFNANVNLVSDNSFYKDLSSNRDARLRQQMISNVGLKKNWEGSSNSLSMNLRRTQNLQTGDIEELFPGFAFRVGSQQLFKPDEGEDTRFYHLLYYSYGVSGERKRSLVHKTTDSTATVTDRTKEKIVHSINLNSPQKFFKYLSVSPSISVSEGWINDWKEPVYDPTGAYVLLDENGSVLTNERKSFKARHTFSSSIQTSTKIYGMFYPGLFSISAVRHVMTPSVSFRYMPDFSSPFYGYVESSRDSLGNPVKFDYFTGSAIGGTPSRSSKSMSFSVSNLFQSKINEGTENEKKLELFTLNFSGGYNFNAERNKMSSLSTIFRTKLVKGASFDMRMSHSFYEWGDGQISNTFIRNPRLTDISFSTGFRLSAPKPSAPGAPVDTAEVDTLEDPGERFVQTDFRKKEQASKWAFNSSFQYSMNKSNPQNTTKKFYMRGGLSFNPTKAWNVSYNYNFNLVKKSITSHSIRIYRELHCWEFGFQWTPSGPGKGYYLKLNARAPQLKDLKIEEHGRPILGY